MRKSGSSLTVIARQMGITRRTLHEWRKRCREGSAAARQLGRPRLALGVESEDFLLEILRSVGPDLGIPTLRGLMPGAPPAALEREVLAYRRSHRRRRRARLYRLLWDCPGSVWATDLAHPPRPVDGWGRTVLAVRDLASGQTLAWMPLARGTAEEVARAVGRLFRRHTAPIVMKSDNGSCFIGPRFRTLLARSGVVHLRSPRAWPQFNGACEAGIGLLRTLTDVLAAGRGRHDLWTQEDLEGARERANHFPRYRGTTLVASKEAWRRRKRVRPDERKRFRLALGRALSEIKKADPRHGHLRLRLRRKAIQQALVDLDYLTIRSGWVRARKLRRGFSPRLT